MCTSVTGKEERLRVLMLCTPTCVHSVWSSTYSIQDRIGLCYLFVVGNCVIRIVVRIRKHCSVHDTTAVGVGTYVHVHRQRESVSVQWCSPSPSCDPRGLCFGNGRCAMHNCVNRRVCRLAVEVTFQEWNI